MILILDKGKNNFPEALKIFQDMILSNLFSHPISRCYILGRIYAWVVDMLEEVLNVHF
jgi:hypothetical protein